MDANCHICGAYFDEDVKFPMLLDCGHTMCLSCVKTISTLRCPLCKEKFVKAVKNLSLASKLEMMLKEEKGEMVNAEWIIQGKVVKTCIPMMNVGTMAAVLSSSAINLIKKAYELKAVELSLDVKEYDITQFSKFLIFFNQNRKLHSGKIEELNDLENFMRLGWLGITNSVYNITKELILGGNKIHIFMEINKVLVNFSEDSVICKRACDLKLNTGMGIFPIYFRPGYDTLLKVLYMHPRVVLHAFTTLKLDAASAIISQFKLSPLLHLFKFFQVQSVNKENISKELQTIQEKFGASFIVITTEKFLNDAISKVALRLRPYCDLELSQNYQNENYMLHLSTAFESTLAHSLTTQDIVASLNEFAELT